jgi:O-methyltransferase
VTVFTAMFQSLISALHKYIRFASWFIKLRKIFSYTPREEFIREAMEYVAVTGLEGDYLEFGVFRGSTFVPAYHFAQRNNLKGMRFYGFDSFAGLPAIKGSDEGGEFTQGQYCLSLEQFKKLISERGVRLAKIDLVKGWYDEVLNDGTAKHLSLEKAALVFVDCDLYESTVPVLNFITDYLQSGTIIAFDDWYCFKGDPEKGEQKAFREWLQRNSSFDALEFHKFGWSGNSFLIHLRKMNLAQAA